ncbi:MAG: hypothetical protein V2A61_03925, partial [Calditrichota bacterium]
LRIRESRIKFDGCSNIRLDTSNILTIRPKTSIWTPAFAGVAINRTFAGVTLKRLILVVILRILLISSTLTTSLSAGEFYISPFIYHINSSDSSLVIKLDQDIRNWLPEAESNLKARLPDRVNVFLTLSEAEFHRLTRGRAPRWAGGIAYPERSRVVVKAPLFFGQGVPLEVLVKHELTHILLHQASGGEYLPRWWEEGFCAVLSGEWRSGSQRRLNLAVMADRLIALPRIDDVLGFSAPDADLAYAEASLAAKLYIEWFGWNGTQRLLTEIKSGTFFEEAFAKVSGLQYEEFQIDFLDYLRHTYRWGVFYSVDDLIWIFILLLAILAVLVSYIRSRRQLKRWEEDEETSDWEDDYTSIKP